MNEINSIIKDSYDGIPSSNDKLKESQAYYLRG